MKTLFRTVATLALLLSLPLTANAQQTVSQCGNRHPSEIRYVSGGSQETGTLLSRIPALDLVNAFNAIFTRFNLACGHLLTVEVTLNENGSPFTVHMSYAVQDDQARTRTRFGRMAILAIPYGTDHRLDAPHGASLSELLRQLGREGVVLPPL